MNQPQRPRRRTKLTTIADVAQTAGVSPMTVSRVINGEAGVRAATRDKVLTALAAMNYPVPAEQAPPVDEAEMSIGVVYHAPSAGYLTDFLIGLLKKANLRHVRLDVQRGETRDDEARLLAGMLAAGVDGIILAPPLCDAERLLELVIGADALAVAVSSGKPPERINAIGIDDHRAAYDMTRHLLQLGHQRIGFIIGDPQQHCSDCRRAGFEQALRDAGMDIATAAAFAQGDFGYRSGLDAADLLLSAPDRPTAVFASNDDMAAATVAIAHRKGLEVPADLTVVGFDDAPVATTIWPELTTLRQPTTQMAGVAVDLLVRHIRARRAGADMPREHLLMSHELVRRQSDAAPRSRPSVRLSAGG